MDSIKKEIISQFRAVPALRGADKFDFFEM
jgi:hypothetical protein